MKNVREMILHGCVVMVLMSSFYGSCAAQMLTVGQEESVVKVPTGNGNTNYTSNRKPLTPSALIKLPVGAVKPAGWLEEYLIRQKNGLTGHLGEISAWLQKQDNAWLSKDGKGK